MLPNGGSRSLTYLDRLVVLHVLREFIDERGVFVAVRSNFLNRADVRCRLIAVKTPLGHGPTKPDRSGRCYDLLVP